MVVVNTDCLLQCGENMKIDKSEKYLGDYLSHTLEESIEVTIAKRKGLVTKSIYDIRAVVDDYRSGVVGGITAGLDIWNLAVMPFLTANSDCWVNLTNKSLQNLNSIQNTFFRSLFAIGAGCPIPIF